MPLWTPSPIFRKRLARFRRLRRGWWSLLLLASLYLLTLGAEVTCNSVPLLLHHEGKWYFPLFRQYPTSAFVAGGDATRADYAALSRSGAFQGDFCLWPLFRNDPYRIVPHEELSPHLRVLCQLIPEPRVAGLTLLPDLTIARATAAESLLPPGKPLPSLKGHGLEEFWQLPQDFGERLAPRWKGSAAPSLELLLAPLEGSPLPAIRLLFPEAQPRQGGRASLRARAMVWTEEGLLRPRQWAFAPGQPLPVRGTKDYQGLSAPLREALEAGRDALSAQEDRQTWEERLSLEEGTFRVVVEREPLRFPFRPVPGHPMGLDNAGRDVFARIFYGLRIALNFGMLLVFFSLTGGTFAGMLQGYRGGWTDLLGQRLTEIWSALPFLYVMILMGSLYGSSFSLLLFCYGLFNWIGISHYMRAETLRLRKMPYVEAARCLGLSGWQIALKHILPNALVPLITLFPFSLVGAIGSLAALDYLGFGLPPPTPSLGELLSQAQADRGAWWLTLFPSLALFLVMLLGVFLGEGVRNAFDPRQQQRLQ